LGIASEPTTSSESAAPHWAFLPPTDPPAPKVRGSSWVQSPIDAFILARLEAAHLRPAPVADRATLLRRVTFDLIGLPPTTDEVAAFLADRSTNAFARVVERLLASPHYGERWGRRWLDLARYADSNGQDENKAMAHAWRYRDYVIASFNQDKPFDRFIREQLAGDLLPPTTDEQENLDRRTATGFLVLGPKMLAEQDKPKLVMDVIDEQIDVVSRAFLGLTVSCSRCHDHKFDPIPTRDYYALAGIFKSTKTMGDLAFVSKWNERSVATRAERTRFDDFVRRTNELQRVWTDLIRQADENLRETGDDRAPWPETFPMLRPLLADVRREPVFVPWSGPRQAAARLAAELEQCRREAPPEPALALAVDEATITDLAVHQRGSHLNPSGPPVSRGFLSVMATRATPPRISGKESGRRELAEWLTQPDHPLTARVTVNRIWQAWFGEGLVRSPDNFGVRGERPSHPELLDWLAVEFVRSGWSVKRLHRLIALSSAYQMSTAFQDRAARVDPENRLLWRMNRRRLEVEPLRDALLAVAGRLDRTMGGSLVSWANAEYTPDDAVSAVSRRRAVYLPVVRDRLYDVFTAFDFANPGVGVGQRTPTVVSHQALFFLNSPFVKEQARFFAESLPAPPARDEDRIATAYQRAFGRAARPVEIRRALRYLAEAQANLGAQAQAPARRDGAPANASDDPTTATQPVKPFSAGAWASLCQALLASSEFLYLD
jgi:hypothetical protein